MFPSLNAHKLLLYEHYFWKIHITAFYASSERTVELGTFFIWIAELIPFHEIAKSRPHPLQEGQNQKSAFWADFCLQNIRKKFPFYWCFSL